MKMAPHTQEVNHHAALLLTCLNRQREQAQFCDCVLKHKESSAQLYPAHRCVLAASSPVLASILSSSGALVELQDPSLSDSVLVLLLDYIYTGTLPYTYNQQQYYRLLTAACHLQMNELQEALRLAWQQTQINATDDVSASTGAEIQLYNSNNNTYKSYWKTFKDPPSPPSTEASERFEEMSKVCSARTPTLDEAPMNSVTLDPCVKTEETCISKNIMNHCGRTDVNILEKNDGITVSEYRHNTSTTKQHLTQETPDTAGVYDVSEANKDVHEDQFHSGGFIKLKIWQRSAEEEPLVTSKEKNSASSSLLPHPCYGAVPVICHGSRVAVHQVTEECALPPYHPAFQSSVSSCRSPVSGSVSTENDKTGDCMITTQNDRCGTQNLDWQCSEKYLISTSNLQLNQDYNNRNNFMINEKRLTAKGLSHITDLNDQYASLRSNMKHLTDDGLVQSKDRNREDFHSESQCFDCFECYSTSLAAEKKEHSPDREAAVPFPVVDSDTGSESHCDDMCHDVEANKEHSYYSRCPAEIDIQDHPNTYSSEKSRKEVNFNQHKYDSDSRHTTIDHKRLSMDLCLPISTTQESGFDNITDSLSNTECITFLKSKKISGTKTTEECLTSKTLVNKKTSDTACTVSQSYNYQIQDAPIEHRNTDYKYSKPWHVQLSVKLSGGNKAASFDQSPKEHTFLKESTEEVVLDTKIKPAELPVSCSSDSEDKGMIETRAESAFQNQGKTQSNEGPTLTWTEMKTIRKRSKFEDDCFDETKRQIKVLRKSVHKDQCRPGNRSTQKTVAVSNYNEDENKITSLPVCSTLCEPDFVQASVPSTLSACVPSTLPKERPSHLSSPPHQLFQCSVCDRSFSQRGSLNRHVRSHLGVRPFSCPCCPMTFSRQYRVTEHMRVHQRCAVGNDFQKCVDSSIRDENRPHS